MKLLFTILFFSIGFANFAQSKLVVFDGGEKKDGKAWVHPRGKAEMKIAYQRPFSNKAHLSFDVRYEGGWAGAGYNWCSWKGKGTDLTDYKFLVFRIGVSKDPVSNLFVELASSNGKGHDAKGSKVMILPMIEKRNQYVKIKIPLEKLTGKNLNIKEVWGINFGVHGKTSEGECKIFIDQIEFTR